MTVAPVTRDTLFRIGVVGAVDVLCDNSCTCYTTCVTGLAPTYTELQVVNKFIVLQECFLADTPCTCYRWEGTPAVTLREVRAAVLTDGTGDDITIKQGIGTTSEVRNGVYIRIIATTCCLGIEVHGQVDVTVIDRWEVS